MPKQKTHSGARKRFRTTRNGKVVHRRQNANHLLEKKPGRRKRRLSVPDTLGGNDAANAKRMLGDR
jgi:large subunit ribosomal protein L35